VRTTTAAVAAATELSLARMVSPVVVHGARVGWCGRRPGTGAGCGRRAAPVGPTSCSATLRTPARPVPDGGSDRFRNVTGALHMATLRAAVGVRRTTVSYALTTIPSSAASAMCSEQGSTRTV
jgi:hypothetical protein